jgi:fructuronate reductase
VLAVFGCLLGYKTIWEAMEDEALVRLVKKIGYDEGLPVVTDPGIIHPKEFIDTVLNERFPNKLVPDTPQRIVCDTSLKIPVRFGETLKLYAERKMDVKSLEYIPVFFAGWLRYLLGTDDKGDPFEPSPDPRLEELRETVKADDLAVILSDKSIFGIDLVEYGLYDKVTGYYRRMNGGKGAVRTVLKGEGHD